MRLRSLLFVPGDRPDRMHKALLSGADALILDLEDSVAPDAKPMARNAIAEFLHEARGARIFVRINPLDSGLVEQDLTAVLPGRPDGIMMPKACGSKDVEAVSKLLPDDMKILPITAETPDAIFALGSYPSVRDRLCGLTWGAEDLATSVGASNSRAPNGDLASPFRLARDLVLFAAHAAEVAAIDTVYANFRDLDGLARCAAESFRDGFSGMMAIHPSQVPVINEAFTPSQEQRDRAQAIVAAFEANPNAGALSLHGRMIDIPHLKNARKLLEMSEMPPCGGA